MRQTTPHQTKESEDLLTSALVERCQHFRFHQQSYSEYAFSYITNSSKHNDKSGIFPTLVPTLNH